MICSQVQISLAVVQGHAWLPENKRAAPTGAIKEAGSATTKHQMSLSCAIPVQQCSEAEGAARGASARWLCTSARPLPPSLAVCLHPAYKPPSGRRCNGSFLNHTMLVLTMFHTFGHEYIKLMVESHQSGAAMELDTALMSVQT